MFRYNYRLAKTAWRQEILQKADVGITKNLLETVYTSNDLGFGGFRMSNFFLDSKFRDTNQNRDDLLYCMNGDMNRILKRSVFTRKPGQILPVNGL